MVCAFTGHRPQRLPWGGNEEDPRCQAVKEMIARLLQQAVDLGCREFLCGMARGCDFYFAEAVLALQEVMPEIRLTAMLPCPGQDRGWQEADQIRYRALCAKCTGREILEPAYSEGCMLRRNRAMVDRTQVLISVYDGGPGGTASTVAYAKRRRVTVWPVWV